MTSSNSNPLIPSVPPIPSSQLERDIQAKHFERQRLNPLPPLPYLREKIVDLTALHAVNPTRYKVDLYEAQHAFSVATDKHAQAKELEQQAKELEQQLREATARERAEAAHQANRQLEAAWNEYNALSLAAAKAYRSLARAYTVASQTPGANRTSLPTGFNIPHLAHDGGVTTPLGSQMMMGSMPWEVK
jgi:hypothetical protein